jgi:hypothetical protein
VPPGAGFELSGDGFSGELSVQVRGESWPDWQSLTGASLRTVDGVPTLFTALDPMPGGRLVVPGLLRVRVVRAEERQLADGTTRRFTFDSNETAVSVVPVVTSVTVPAPASGNPHRINGGPFSGPGIDADAVRLALGADELVQVGGNVTAGEFRIIDRSTIRFRPPAGFSPGDLVRVRLIVNGAECLPAWYVAP